VHFVKRHSVNGYAATPQIILDAFQQILHLILNGIIEQKMLYSHHSKTVDGSIR